MLYHCDVCGHRIEEDEFTTNNGLCEECAREEAELAEDFEQRTEALPCRTN